MAKTKPRIFNATIWDSLSLELTEWQLPVLDRLKEIIQSIESPIADQLMEGNAVTWSQADMKGLERVIMARLGSESRPHGDVDAGFETGETLGDELKHLMDCLAKVVDLVIRTAGAEAPRPRYFQRIHLEINPFRHDIRSAEARMNRLKLLVQRGYANWPSEIGQSLAAVLLASISRYQLLDVNLQIAWLEALAHKSENIIYLKDQICSIQLQVAFRNQPRAERRMYILDCEASRLLKRIDEREVSDTIERLTDKASRFASRAEAIETNHRQKQRIIDYLNQIVDTFVTAHLPGEEPISLTQMTEAAKTMAYLSFPAGIAAYRRRKTISHAPRLQVLRRIHLGAPIEHDETSAKASTEDSTVLHVADAEIYDSSELEPRWYVEMRSAFRRDNKKELRAALNRIAGGEEAISKRMVEFALHLLSRCEISTAARYSLLIARRLGCRQDGDKEFDPAELSVPELESLYEEILDEQREGTASDTDDELLGYDKRPVVEAIRAFHDFLRKEHQVGELEELKDRLHPKGLLPVDANFITIDEYEHVLDEIDGDTGLNDPYVRESIKHFVSLCFWCGLRREEALGLRTVDLDAAGHLHIRPHKDHKLKTSNANRSLPAAVLMPDQRYLALVARVKERADASRSGDEILIFSRQQDASALLSRKLIYGTTMKKMRCSLKDRSLKIHHLRHSCATLLTIKLLPGMKAFAMKLLERHVATQEWLKPENGDELRRRLFLNDLVLKEDFTGIAHLLGHGSPRVSVEHYIHCLDWCRAIE